MKKNILLFAMFAAVSAVSCSKTEGVIDNKPQDVSCVLVAEVEPGTKTSTSSDFKVTWSAGDALAVYTWPAGTELPSDAAVWRSAEPEIGRAHV